MASGPPAALATAEARRNSVVYVDLKGVSRMEHAASAIAEAAHVAVPTDRTAVHTLRATTRAIEGAFVVIDHLDDVPELWAELISLYRGPLLGTSRVAAPGGVTLRIPPLDTAAAQVFIRAECRRQGTPISAERAEELVEVVDGLPLALKRLAGNISVIGTHTLDPLLALTLPGPSPTDPTLEEAIRTSVDRLTPAAVGTLSTLSVVCGSIDFSTASRWFDGVAIGAWRELLDASLLCPSPRGFRLLSTLRAFASRADPEAVRLALIPHMRWMADFSTAQVGQLRRAGGRKGLEALEARADDLEQAWRCALELHDDRAILPLTRAVDAILVTLGTPADRRERMEIALAAIRDDTILARLRLHSHRVDVHRDRTGAHQAFEQVSEQLWSSDPSFAAEAAREAARMTHWLEGPVQALARLEAIPLDGLPAEPRLLVEMNRLWYADMVGGSETLDVQRGLTRCSEDLAHLGDLHGAIRAGIAASDRMRLTGVDDAVAHMRRVASWARKVADAGLLAQALLVLGTRMGEALHTDEALQVMHEAEALFERVEPIRRWQVVKHRGTALVHGRRHDGARLELESYLHWSEGRSSPMGAADARLWLAALECEAGRPRRAEVHARRAIEQAGEAGNQHFVDHARMHGVLCLIQQARLDEARDWLQAGSPGTNAYERLRWATLRHVVATLNTTPPPPDDLPALAAELSGHLGDRARRITEAGLSGDHEVLEQETTGAYGVLAIRLVALTWLQLHPHA